MSAPNVTVRRILPENVARSGAEFGRLFNPSAEQTEEIALAGLRALFGPNDLATLKRLYEETNDFAALKTHPIATVSFARGAACDFFRIEESLRRQILKSDLFV